MVSLKKTTKFNLLSTMDKRHIKIRKFITNIGFLSLFITSSHSNSVEIDINYGKQNINNNRIKIQSSNNELSNNISNNYLKPSYIYSYGTSILLADNNEKNSNILISEIIIEGWEDHPEGRNLELVAYDSMRPSASITACREPPKAPALVNLPAS